MAITFKKIQGRFDVTKFLFYYLKKRKIKNAINFLKVRLFVKQENCGIGILKYVFFNRFPRLLPIPKEIEIEHSTRCYLNCVICERTYWSKNGGFGEHINKVVPLEDFKKILSQFPKLYWINVTGEGNSFMNKDFMDILKYLKSRSIYVIFVDDFNRLDSKISKELIEQGIDKICASIDGATKETYEKVRIGANFETVIKNIKDLINLKKELNSPLPEIVFRYTFFDWNYKEMSGFLDLVSSLGDRNFIGGKYIDIEMAGLLEFEETKEWVHEPSEEVIDALMKKADRLGINLAMAHPSHDESKKPSIHNCKSWGEPYIMITGDVVSCCAVMMSKNRPFLSKNSWGNVYEKPFEEIWNSRRYKEFRSLVPNPNGEVPILCEGCRAYETKKRVKKHGVSKKI